MAIEKKYGAGRITGRWIEVYAVGSTANDAYTAAREAGCTAPSVLEIDQCVAAKAAARIAAGWKYLHHIGDRR